MTRRRSLLRDRLSGHCHCRRSYCKCCLTHTFRINLLIKRYKFRLEVCVKVSYVRWDNGFYFSIEVNEIRVFHREIPVRHPPALCFPVPKLKFLVSACIGIYDVNFRAKSMCLEAYALVNLWFSKFKFGIKLGCFRIPMQDEDLDIPKLLQHIDMSVGDMKTGEVHEVALSDLLNLYRQLQIEPVV